ncbi:MAG: hypothetical protein WDW38_001208 [Sanguina aurantia]
MYALAILLPVAIFLSVSPTAARKAVRVPSSTTPSPPPPSAAAAAAAADGGGGASHSCGSRFDAALAAGMGLVDACASVQGEGGVSMIKNLRLVSKAASNLALQAVTGYSLQLGKSLPGSPPDRPAKLMAILNSSRLKRLQVALPGLPGATGDTQEWNHGPLELQAYFTDLRTELDTFLNGIPKALASVTSLKLATRIFVGETAARYLEKTSNLLSPLAAQCPALTQLSIDGDIGVGLLQAFGTNCADLVSFVEAVGSLPASTASQLGQLLPHLTCHSIMFEKGGWGVLLAAMQSVTAPITFDLCGRALRCTSPLCLVQGQDVTLCNGMIVMPHSDPATPDSSVIIAGPGQLHLERVIMFESAAGASEGEQLLWRIWHPLEGGRQSSSPAIRVSALSHLDLTALPTPMPPSKLVASGVVVVSRHRAGGLIMQGRGSHAVLSDCAFENHGSAAITVMEHSHLGAARVRVACKDDGNGLYVCNGSRAELVDCTITGSDHYSVRSVGQGSVVTLTGCSLDQEVMASRGGRYIHVCSTVAEVWSHRYTYGFIPKCFVRDTRLNASNVLGFLSFCSFCLTFFCLGGWMSGPISRWLGSNDGK